LWGPLLACPIGFTLGFAAILVARLRAAVASALMRWEPRIRLTRIVIERDPATPARADLTLIGTFNNTRRPAPLSLQMPIARTLS